MSIPKEGALLGVWPQGRQSFWAQPMTMVPEDLFCHKPQSPLKRLLRVQSSWCPSTVNLNCLMVKVQVKDKVKNFLNLNLNLNLEYLKYFLYDVDFL